MASLFVFDRCRTMPEEYRHKCTDNAEVSNNKMHFIFYFDDTKTTAISLFGDLDLPFGYVNICEMEN
jgi:hypothetical protein